MNDSMPELRRHILANEVFALVGADFPIYAGLPDIYDVLTNLVLPIDYEMPPRKYASTAALLDAAQAYVNRFGLHSLIANLKTQLDAFAIAPSAVHYALARLPISLIFTTNYDNLLERAYRDIGKHIEVIVKDDHIPFMRGDRVNLVKIFGDLNQPESLIITREQHESFFLQRPQLVRLLGTEFARSTALYLGWNYGHLPLDIISGESLTRFGSLARPGYAFLFDATETQLRELYRKQIQGITFQSTTDRFGQVAAWLESLMPLSSILPPAENAAQAGDAPRPNYADAILNSGKTWAVLVGVNVYGDSHIPALKVCANDSTDLFNLLTVNGTFAKLLNDQTIASLPIRANILGELSTMAQVADENDLILFFFSGHGFAEDDESFLLPCDTRLTALSYTAIAMREVREIFDQSRARAKVILVDACHSGAAIGKDAMRMTEQFIQRVFAEAEGMAILASCKQGQLSYEWQDQDRSVFTHFLLEALNGKADYDRKGFVTVSDASRYVADGVKAWSFQHGVMQTPTLQYTVAGDIVLL